MRGVSRVGNPRVGETKAGRPHLLPLPQPLVALLRQLPRMASCPYVFPGRNGHGHLINVKRAWERIRTKAGIPDVRIHDLRRTVGSWLAGSGESLPMIAKVLNHRDVSTTAIYARLHLDPVRRALERNAHRLLLAAGGSGRGTRRKKRRATGSSQSVLTVMTGKAVILRSP